MSPTSIEYLRALAARHNAYELLLALEEHPQADDSCFRNLGGIVDQIVFHEISLNEGELGGLRGLVTSEAPDVSSTLAVLAVSLSEAEPNRGCVHVLLAGYPKWLKGVSEVGRPHFLGILPNIAAHLEELGGSGMDTLVASFNACSSAGDCEILAGCVDRYRETSGSILIAAAEIASVAIRTNSRLLVEKLMSAVSPEAMLDSKPARELLPALAKLKAPAAVESVWAAAIGVCVAVAGNNHSSALNLARHLEESMAALTPETQLAYLTSFQRIVEETGISLPGISLLGYGTKQLPGLFQKAGVERATEFVAQGIAIARRYGRVAAEEFFEQKTAASRQASPLG